MHPIKPMIPIIPFHLETPDWSSIFTKVPKVKRIIYNDPATIVFWEDGTKTVVKKQKGIKFNKYNAFTAAFAIKCLGSNSKLNHIVDSGVDQTKKNKKGNK